MRQSCRIHFVNNLPNTRSIFMKKKHRFEAKLKEKRKDSFLFRKFTDIFEAMVFYIRKYSS